jgi:hypothetical protein
MTQWPNANFGPPGGFGLAATGVYSQADLAANAAGMAFWQKLVKNLQMEFKISDFVTKEWSEEVSPNVYGPDVKKVLR